MSEKISIIKDVFTNTPHVIAVDDDGLIKIKALTEYGKSIISENEYISDYISLGIPDGFVKTDFKELSPTMREVFNSAFSDADWNSSKLAQISSKAINTQKTKSFIDRRKNLLNQNKFKNPSSRSLFKFRNKTNKINILNYKAKTFKDNAASSSLAEKIKSNELAFDTKSNKFFAKNNSALAAYKLEEIIKDTKNERLMRRAQNEQNKKEQTLLKGAKRRAARRALMLSSSDLGDSEKPENTLGNQKFKQSIKSKIINRKKFLK